MLMDHDDWSDASGVWGPCFERWAPRWEMTGTLGIEGGNRTCSSASGTQLFRFALRVCIWVVGLRSMETISMCLVIDDVNCWRPRSVFAGTEATGSSLRRSSYYTIPLLGVLFWNHISASCTTVEGGLGIITKDVNDGGYYISNFQVSRSAKKHARRLILPSHQHCCMPMKHNSTTITSSINHPLSFYQQLASVRQPSPALTPGPPAHAHHPSFPPIISPPMSSFPPAPQNPAIHIAGPRKRPFRAPNSLTRHTRARLGHNAPLAFTSLRQR
jgi:hypothetical protein